jgi:hypothetical protein
VGPLTATLAALAAAIGGGTYQAKVDAPCDSTCVARVVVVDDGHSLTTRSFVGAPCDLAETTDADSKPAPRGTPVNADGSFRWRTRFQVVEGRFAADGKSVSGTTRFLGRARGDCSATTFTFTAPLKRHAKPNGKCEPLDARGLEIQVFARRTGCTKATRVVDAWSGDRDCVTKAHALRACRAGGRRCTPVLGGRLSALSSVACPAGRIELVVSKPCGGGGGGGAPGGGQGPGGGSFLDVRAINTGCTEAEGVARAWANNSRCAAHSCTAAGWHCGRPHGSPERARCRRGHAAADIQRRPIIFDGPTD